MNGWYRCRSALFASCLHSRCESTSAPNRSHGVSPGTAGETPDRTHKILGVRCSDRCHKKSTASQHCWANGWRRQTPFTTVPCELCPTTQGSQSWASHAWLPKQRLCLFLSSLPPSMGRAAGIRTCPIWSHRFAPAFLEELHNRLCVHVSVG